eukprot:Skav210647  [mRNA]  locus=scaffold2527:20822:21700:+ [translate_table: standard]
MFKLKLWKLYEIVVQAGDEERIVIALAQRSQSCAENKAVFRDFNAAMDVAFQPGSARGFVLVDESISARQEETESEYETEQTTVRRKWKVAIGVLTLAAVLVLLMVPSFHPSHTAARKFIRLNEPEAGAGANFEDFDGEQVGTALKDLWSEGGNLAKGKDADWGAMLGAAGALCSQGATVMAAANSSGGAALAACGGISLIGGTLQKSDDLAEKLNCAVSEIKKVRAGRQPTDSRAGCAGGLGFWVLSQGKVKTQL